MMEFLQQLHTWAWIVAGMIFAISIFVAMSWGKIKELYSNSTALTRFVFVASVIGLTMYGGTKGIVTFPYTDVESRYLIDAGSYVTNDYVHVAFSRVIAPATADILIERRRLDMTNDNDWVTHLVTTFADFANPTNIQFAAATNWNWIVYTTWTPGAAVQTNGVWHSYWGLDRKSRSKLVPARSCIRVDGEVIATPKSKWDNEGSADETDDE